MPDASQGQPEAISADDFRNFQNQVAEFAQAQAREIEALKQQRAAQAQPQPAQPNLPPDVDEKLRDEIISNPRRYTAEVVAIAKKQARDEIMKEVTEREEQARQGAYWQGFWGQFFSVHPELSELQGEVMHGFQQSWARQPNADHVQLAEYVAGEVHQRAKRLADAARQQEERQKRGARQAAGAPGSMALPPMAQDGAVQDGQPERVTAKDALIEAMSEHERARAKKMWNNIDTPEYRAAAMDRAARVVLKRSA